MKSVRLDPNLEGRLKAAAEASGEPESALIRRAIERECNEILNRRLDLRLRDFIGIADGGGGRAERAGAAFREILVERKQAGRL